MPYFAYKKSGAAANTDYSSPDHDVFCCGNGIWSDVYADRKLHAYAHSAEFDGGEGCIVVEDSSYTP